MVTTIQVDEETLSMLKNLEHDHGYNTHNEAIKRLILENKRLRRSKKGKFPKLKTYEREELDRLSGSH